MKQNLILIALLLASAAWFGTAAVASGDAGQAGGGAYTESNWKTFTARHAGNKAMKLQPLCKSAKNREVEMLRIDSRRSGMYRLLLTARHDAGDTVSSHVLEGMLDTLLGDDADGKWIRERTEIAAVPFVDKDGVEDGAPGTDYSLDYGDANTLAATTAIKAFMKPGWAEFFPTVVIDLHASAAKGKPADAVLISGQDGADGNRVRRFAELLRTQPHALACATVAGETGDRLGFIGWVARLTSVRFAVRVEVPPGTAPEAARAFGRDLAKALRQDLEGNEAAFQDLYSARADLKYKISLPKGYAENPNKKWPLILWLHGAGPCYSYESVLALGVPRYVLDTPDFPFITLTPLVPVARWESCTEALNFLLEEVMAKYRADTQRVYMTGQSLGGGGTWEMAMQHPEKFAAVAPASGAGCFPGLENMKGIPVWAIQGDVDVPVPRKYHQATIDAFLKVGGEVKFPSMPGIGHDVYRDVYMKPELYDWFLQYTNPGLKPVPQNFEGVEMVTLEPMLVAFAESPTSDNWKSVEQFAADNHLLEKPETRFFTLSWRSGGRAVTVGPGVKGNESFTIKKVFGGRYVVQNVQQPYDAGPGPMGVYRDEARAYRWRSLHGFKFTMSGVIHEHSGSPLKLAKMYLPIVETVENINQEKQK
jgi:predicted esterase